MAVVTFQDLSNALKGFIGDNTSDEALAFMENFTDTFNSLTAEKNDGTDWKQKYEENDAAWRKRYSDRFWGTEELDNRLPPDMKKPESTASPSDKSPAAPAENDPEADTFDTIFSDGVSPAGASPV